MRYKSRSFTDSQVERLSKVGVGGSQNSFHALVQTLGISRAGHFRKVVIKVTLLPVIKFI